MINFKSKRQNLKLNWLRLLPYIAVGGLIFYSNSATDLNYIFKGYFVLLEAQAGMLLLLFLTGKLSRNQRSSL